MKWRTDTKRDGVFSGFLTLSNGNLWGTREGRVAVFIDPVTGKALNEYQLLWPGSGASDGDRLYGFTSDGLAFAMQLKPLAK